MFLFPRKLMRQCGIGVILVATLGACSHAPKTTSVRPAVSPRPAPASAPAIVKVVEESQAPSGWFDLETTSVVGPTWDEGTYVVLDGARALVRPDGTIVYEKALTPEPLEKLLSVPTAKGKRLVGVGRRGIYRFDDPLGAGTLLAVGIPSIVGSAPSAVVLRPGGSLGPDIFLDIDSGARLSVTHGQDSMRIGPFSLPLLPTTRMAFEDLDHGRIELSSLGVLRTEDAGKTWQDAGRDWPARLNAANEPLLLQWLSLTHQSPAHLAVGPGFDMPDHQAFALVDSKVVRIDTQTLEVLEILDYADIKDAAPCRESNPGPAAWLGCKFKNDPEPRQLGLFAMTRPEDELVLTSPSGGAMLTVPCKPKKVLPANEVCVRTPNGAWETVILPKTAAMMGPLADGRVAYLQNPTLGPPAVPVKDDPGCCQAPTVLERNPEEALRIVLRDSKGVEQVMAPLDLPKSIDPYPLGGIEEAAENGDLHLLLRADQLTNSLMPSGDNHGNIHFITQPKQGPAKVEVLNEANHAALHGRNIVAIGGKKIRTKIIGGEWTDVRAPEKASFWVDVQGVTVHARDAGYSFEHAGHLGWATDELVLRPAFSGGLVVGAAEIGAPAIALRCTTKGRGNSDKWGGINDKIGMASGLAALAPPTKLEKKTGGVWNFEVLDPAEENAELRRFPIDLGNDASTKDVYSVTARGANTLAVVTGSQKKWLVDLRQGAKPNIVPGLEKSSYLDAKVGTGPKIPSVLLAGEGYEFAKSTIYAWFVGENPRPMYELVKPRLHQLTLGEPTAEGVPILLQKHEYIVWKLLPYLESSAAPRRVDATGWTKIDLVTYPSRLPTCTQPAPPGAVTFVLADSLDAVIDGTTESVPGSFVAAYRVRIAGATACVSEILAPLLPDEIPEEAQDNPAKMPGVSFVRVNFATGRAQGGAHQSAQPLRQLQCTRGS